MHIFYFNSGGYIVVQKLLFVGQICKLHVFVFVYCVDPHLVFVHYRVLNRCCNVLSFYTICAILWNRSRDNRLDYGQFVVVFLILLIAKKHVSNKQSKNSNKTKETITNEQIINNSLHPL